MQFKFINPIAKALAYNKKRKQILKNRKGKGSYERAENILYDMESELLPIEEIDVITENKPNEEYDYETLED